MERTTIQIVVAAHKPYWFPADKVYLPVHVGAAGKNTVPGCVRDDTGDNISVKNANYCELTGLYWAWKNLKADYVGLAHYRRHFSNGKIIGSRKERVISGNELDRFLSKTADNGVHILLPKPRNYWIETNYSQYAHAHHAIDLDTAREIIADYYPEYISAFDKSMRETIGHRFNMFIMRNDKLNEYCNWLFDILFRLEKSLDISSYNQYDSRVFGFVSERLLDVWIETSGYRYSELPFVFMEKQNWLIKAGCFMKRKLENGEQK